MLVARVSVIQTPSELVLTKISMFLKDDGFKVPSSQATEALEAASTLLDWCKEDTNKKQFIVFSKWLVVTKQLLHSFRLEIFGTDGKNVGEVP